MHNYKPHFVLCVNIKIDIKRCVYRDSPQRPVQFTCNYHELNL